MASGGWRWYVFGAQAVQVFGVPRATADVDITIEVADDALDGLVDAMDKAGFQLRATSPGFVRRTRVLPFFHRSTRIPLDAVRAGPGLEERFIERARVIDFGAGPIPVMSPEDLIVTKILSARPKDLNDVRGLLRAQAGALDRDYVQDVLSQLESALGQSDLLAQMTRLSRDVSDD